MGEMVRYLYRKRRQGLRDNAISMTSISISFPHHFMEIQMAAAANFPFGFPIVLSAF